MERMLLLIILCTIISFVQPDVLQNPDFELPPANLPSNSTSTLITLQENNTIPGWSFEGLVQYVTSGKNMSLLGNGHAIRLGENGKINQTFTADSNYQIFFLTFAMSLGGQNCTANVDVGVSTNDSMFRFSHHQNYSKGVWDIIGLKLGSWGGGAKQINLVLESVHSEHDYDPHTTCWPIVDSLRIKTIDSALTDGLLDNGGFEVGPQFLENSSEGVLLDFTTSPNSSVFNLAALEPWTTTGIIRYISSKNYYIPEGDAAVEFVSGVGVGIHTFISIPKDSIYVLEFMLGDANDSCVGEFVVGVYAGSSNQNFSFQSAGTGSSKKYSITFSGESDEIQIIFESYRTYQREDGIFCGPVLDDVFVLRAFGIHGNKFPAAFFLFVVPLFLILFCLSFVIP